MPQTPDQPLLGQSAVVTGSSSGIGRAIALELARAGADVLVHARENRAGADEVAGEVLSLDRQTSIILADLSDPEEQDRLVDSAWQWRAIDIWVNNAGADVLTSDAANWPFEQKLAALWSVDVVATLRLSRAVGARMAEQASAGDDPRRTNDTASGGVHPRRIDPAGGCIINIGWDQAETGMEGDSGQMFAAAKGAVMAATRSLAKSLAPKVRVNCIAPGWIRTAWGHEASADWQERAKRESLLARWGQPEDIARVARFLASPEAEFVNGEIIHVNGGRP